MRAKKRPLQKGKAAEGCKKILKITRRMSILVKKRGIHRSEKAGKVIFLRSKASRHAFFRFKTQKDSSPIHQLDFSGIQRTEAPSARQQKTRRIRRALAENMRFFYAIRFSVYLRPAYAPLPKDDRRPVPTPWRIRYICCTGVHRFPALPGRWTWRRCG